MAYLSERQLKDMGLKRVGKNVKISELARIYNPELTEIGDNTRIDDFCVLSGRVVLGSYVHLALYTHIGGGSEGVFFEDFSGCAYNCVVIARSDDYSGRSLGGPFYPKEFCTFTVNKKVVVGKYAMLGAFCFVMPGVTIGEGCSFGAYCHVVRSTRPWGIYYGQPAKRVGEREKGVVELLSKYFESKQDS